MATTSHDPRRRETAAALLRRRNIAPVSLGHAGLDERTGGLRAGSIGAIIGPSATQASGWLRRVAAAHLVAGGSLQWLAYQTSFDEEGLHLDLERALCERDGVRLSELVARLGSVDALATQLRSLLSRVSVAQIADEDDLSATLEEIATADTCVEELNPAAQAPGMLLLCVEGLGPDCGEGVSTAAQRLSRALKGVTAQRREVAMLLTWRTPAWSPPTLLPLAAWTLFAADTPCLRKLRLRTLEQATGWQGACAGCARGAMHEHVGGVTLLTMGADGWQPALTFVNATGGVQLVA
jgi:bacterioferritin-associated ferredoxin